MSDQPELPEITVIGHKPSSFTVQASAARYPRGIVNINGTAVSGWESWSVSNNSYYEADTYRVVYAASALLEEYDIAWFSSETETFVEIFGGLTSNPKRFTVGELTSFIYGRVDDVEYDPVTQTMTLTGRDLTGAFIDAKIATDYTNQTASAIAISLAKAHGLQYEVTPTKGFVGNFANPDSMQLYAGRSEWDLLSSLARQEGFVTYVSGQTLYFGPDQSGSGTPFVLNYQRPGNRGGPPHAPVIDLSFSRSLTVAKGISVTVRSAGRFGKTVSQSYPVAPRGTSAGKSSPYGATTDYYYNLPAGATASQALARAKAIYKQIIQHAMKLKCRLPADEVTTPQSTIQVTGTGTAFDQTYFPQTVTRTLGFDGGFVMEIEAQNTSPNLAPAEPPPPKSAVPAQPDNSGASDEADE